MSHVRGIGGSNPVSPLQRTNPNNPNSLQNFKISFHESFEFPHKKLTIKEEHNAVIAAQERPLYSVLLKLLLEILDFRIDIVPTQPRDAGGYVQEAYFKPAEGLGGRSAIHLPLPIKAVTKKVLKAPSGEKLTPEFKEFVALYAEKIVQNFTDEQILRLIIVAAHEFGHFQSYVRGNHDENLKRGLFIFQKKYLNTTKADEYTWLVFREECLAWNYAETFLRKTSFSYWDTYTEVKNHSLKTYFDNLNLTNASLETFYKLSFLGDDFKNNSPSHLFTKEGLRKTFATENQEASGA